MFNPYADWLGVQATARPPNHYDLLRLEPFESSPDAILTAANMQMAKVRAVRPGDHFDDWRRVLDELNAAKRCLCDPAEKLQYDDALRATGWGGAHAAKPTTFASTANRDDSATKRSPYMEVTGHVISNPLPPGFGSNKTASGSGAAESERESTPNREASAGSTGWQPGTNLLPPKPPAPAGNSAAKPKLMFPGETVPDVSKPAAPISPAASSTPGAGSPPATDSSPATKPKLVFPGETVPDVSTPAAAVSPPGAPISPPAASPLPMFPAAAGTPAPAPFPASGLPRPFPPFAIPAAPQPPAPQPPAPQQPVASPFFPGAPRMPGQFPPFAPSAPATPGGFPAPNAPNPYAGQAPAPGGIAGFYPGMPMPGAMFPGAAFPGAAFPGAAFPGAAFPGAARPGAVPPGMAPPAMMPQQPAAQQPAAPQAAAPAASNFLDDVLSGPQRGGSPLDELGIGESSPAPQPAFSTQPGQFPSSASTGIEPGGFVESSSAGNEPYEPSTRRSRSGGRSQQSSRGVLIGSALGLVALLAGGLAAAMILRQRDDKQIAAGPTANGDVDPSANPANPAAPAVSPKTDISPTGPHVTPSTGSTVGPTPSPAQPAPPNNVASNSAPPTMPKPGSSPNSNPSAQSGSPLVLQPTAPNPSAPHPSSNPPNSSVPKPVAVDPAMAARLNHLLADVRQKLGERDEEDAGRMIAEAKSLAVTPEQTVRVERMGTLVKYVGEFWGAVRDALAALKVTDEIDVGTTKVIVVEADQQSLSIHMGAGNRTFTLKTLPPGLAIALANRWLDPNKPANKVFIGAFCAVDPKMPGAADQAKQLWDAAAAAGVTDGKYLLPLLEPDPAEAEMTGADEALPPVPDADAVQRATLKIKEEFDSAIVGATTRHKIDELVQRFFDAATSSDNAARKYALCILARDTAAKAGRAKLTIDAIDRIARDFRVDGLDMKADTLVNNPPANEEAAREITRAALTLVDEAVSAKRMALASRLAQVAVNAAQVSKGNDLIRRATQRSKEVEALAGKKMAADPR